MIKRDKLYLTLALLSALFISGCGAVKKGGNIFYWTYLDKDVAKNKIDIGYSYWMKNDFKTAENYFAQAKALDPTSSQARYYHANCVLILNYTNFFQGAKEVMDIFNEKGSAGMYENIGSIISNSYNRFSSVINTVIDDLEWIVEKKCDTNIPYNNPGVNFQLAYCYTLNGFFNVLDSNQDNNLGTRGSNGDLIVFITNTPYIYVNEDKVDLTNIMNTFNELVDQCQDITGAQLSTMISNIDDLNTRINIIHDIFSDLHTSISNLSISLYNAAKCENRMVDYYSDILLNTNVITIADSLGGAEQITNILSLNSNMVYYISNLGSQATELLNSFVIIMDSTISALMDMRATLTTVNGYLNNTSTIQQLIDSGDLSGSEITNLQNSLFSNFSTPLSNYGITNSSSFTNFTSDELSQIFSDIILGG